MAWGEEDREPIATYEQAVYGLLSKYGAYEWIFDPHATLPNEAKIVCDVFWINEKTLRTDLRKAWGGP